MSNLEQSMLGHSILMLNLELEAAKKITDPIREKLTRRISLEQLKEILRQDERVVFLEDEPEFIHVELATHGSITFKLSLPEMLRDINEKLPIGFTGFFEDVTKFCRRL